MSPRASRLLVEFLIALTFFVLVVALAQPLYAAPLKSTITVFYTPRGSQNPDGTFRQVRVVYERCHVEFSQSGSAATFAATCSAQNTSMVDRAIHVSPVSVVFDINMSPNTCHLTSMDVGDRTAVVVDCGDVM